MIGLGVGIDYSLFIVTRYRENTRRRHDDRSGGRPLGRHRRLKRCCSRACTVVIAICGLAISGIPYVAKLGYMAGARGGGDDARRDHAAPRGDRCWSGKDIDRWRVPSLIHHRDRGAAAAPRARVRSGRAGPRPSPATRGSSPSLR